MRSIRTSLARPRTRRLVAVAISAALCLGCVTVAAVPPVRAAAAGGRVDTLLDVSFRGTFHGDSYVPGQRERVGGALMRTSGRESLDQQTVSLDGGTSGLQFVPSADQRTGSTATKSLIAEVVVERATTVAPLGTLLGIFGGTYYRYPQTVTGATEFGMAGATTPDATGVSRDVDDAGYEHVALVYRTAADGTSTLSAYVDGCQVGPTVRTAAPVAAPVPGFGFGRDPQAGDRGFAGDLRGVAVSTFTGAFSTHDFRLPVPTMRHPITAAQVVPVDPCDSPQTIVDKAAHVVPTQTQKDWQHHDLTGFIHFGPDTFTNAEPGNSAYPQPTGNEPPTTFAPTHVDTDQWARSFHDAGFTKVILVAKHHDGFLLWPSRYTDYSVKSDTAWRDAHGDLVGDFVRSAHRYGLKVGFYLSPADLHEALPGGRYGDGSTPKPVTIPTPVDGSTPPGPMFHFTLDDYNTYYLNTMYELMTRYGRVDEVWLDGYNPTNRPEPYDFADWFSMIRALQPHAAIFNGRDIRWVGNEDGAARTSEWSPLPFYGDPASGRKEVASEDNGDLGGRDRLTNQASYLGWYPAECDVRINPNWFWHAGETPKTLAQLQGIYYTSVGRNCPLLLDVPPDKTGQLHPDDVSRLAEFGRWVHGAFGKLVTGAVTPVPDSTRRTWQVTLPRPSTMNVVKVQESLDVGQRVESFAVDAWRSGAWQTVATGDTIGAGRLLALGRDVTTDRLRVRVLGTRATPAITTLDGYLD